jgi:hypothetical protein
LAHPARAAECEQRHAFHARRFGSIGGNPVGKRMRRVNDERDLLRSDIVGEAGRATKTADAGRDRQRLGIERPPGKRDSRVEIAAHRQPLGQLPCFGGAAEYQDPGSAHA